MKRLKALPYKPQSTRCKRKTLSQTKTTQKASVHANTRLNPYKHTHVNTASTQEPRTCSPTHTTMYPTHRRHTNTKTTPPQSSPSQMSTQITPPTHQATTIQSASQTRSQLTKILNQHGYTKSKYTHVTAQATKRNNRTHVGIARREIPPNLQNEYNKDSKTNKHTTKIQNQENRENPKSIVFCPIQ